MCCPYRCSANDALQTLLFGGYADEHEKTHQKGVNISDFMFIFAMPFGFINSSKITI